jgi:hypothetical protein
MKPAAKAERRLLACWGEQWNSITKPGTALCLD